MSKLKTVLLSVLLVLLTAVTIINMSMLGSMQSEIDRQSKIIEMYAETSKAYTDKQLELLKEYIENRLALLEGHLGIN